MLFRSRRGEEHGVAGLDDGAAEGDRQVRLADAGRNSHILRSFSVPSSSTICWHPFVGQQLTVKSIQRAPDGQRALRCLLPDGTWTFLPEWMTSREQCARLMLVDEPCVSVGALEALIGLLRSLPRAAAPARIEAEAMSKDKEARRDATTAIRPGSTGTGMDESYAVGGRARRHPRPRPRAPQRSPAAGHDSAPARRGIGR